MNILSINTCFKNSDVTLFTDKKDYSAKQESALQHSVVLMGQIDDVFQQANMNSTDIDYVCVAIGPGSFTGIRIGLAVAKGICDANSKKIIPIDTLSLIAINSNITPNFVAIKGIADEYFVGKCDDGVVVERMLLKKDEFNKILQPDAIVVTIDDLSNDDLNCTIQNVVELNTKQIAIENIKNAVAPLYVQPLYLRLSQAEMQKKEASNANS